MTEALQILALLENKKEYWVMFPYRSLYQGEIQYRQKTRAKDAETALKNIIFRLPEVYYISTDEKARRNSWYRSKADKAVLFNILKTNDDWDVVEI